MTTSPREQTQFSVHTDPVGRVLTVSGELDVETTPLLTSAVDSLAGRSGDLTIEISGLTFIDSAGLNEFVRIGISQHLARSAFILRGVTAGIRRTFTLGGLDGLFR